jgi:hypothetical protein
MLILESVYLERHIYTPLFPLFSKKKTEKILTLDLFINVRPTVVIAFSLEEVFAPEAAAEKVLGPAAAAEEVLGPSAAAALASAAEKVLALHAFDAGVGDLEARKLLQTTHRRPWTGSQLFLRYLLDQARPLGLDSPGARVLELGSGTGWLGLNLATRLQLSITLTDLPTALPALRAHVARVAVALGDETLPRRVRVGELDWTSAEHLALAAERFDWVQLARGPARAGARDRRPIGLARARPVLPRAAAQGERRRRAARRVRAARAGAARRRVGAPRHVGWGRPRRSCAALGGRRRRRRACAVAGRRRAVCGRGQRVPCELSRMRKWRQSNTGTSHSNTGPFHSNTGAFI